MKKKKQLIKIKYNEGILSKVSNSIGDHCGRYAFEFRNRIGIKPFRVGYKCQSCVGRSCCGFVVGEFNFKVECMEAVKITALVEELMEKEVDYKDYQGKVSQTRLVQKGNATILEQIIRKHLLDSHDEKIGVLEAKVFAYEQIISKSNFAPFIEDKNKD